ncbi:hypothetical protein SAMN05660484_02265 [Eubacterium ruminantium]|uniref:Uncharacterized protein n=1 Tax=Eubacterium ruminantium TaxID=42322 RepID=A0A1T4Q210_9FIRM|nr:hypothetical protein [Eubacterium ruminantium]SCW64600.1 hypothetical protein SAMN05660484_02265 [Eubacterium ruminantium]SDN29125.1 hypothetical protein SAMN04490370_1165 [Eubacterium ruminantium]SJZ97860.1 hypothetical protein SAMN02745110_02218 [Eubacterium ruminantium]
MDTLDKIYDKMYCELEEISNKEKLDSKDVELVDKFVDIIKDINEIDSMDDMGGFSQGNGRSYGNGASYGRNRFGRTMGMYGRGSYGRSMTGGYSRDESKNTMINHLQEVADMAMDEKDRKAVMRLIEQMEMR